MAEGKQSQNEDISKSRLVTPDHLPKKSGSFGFLTHPVLAFFVAALIGGVDKSMNLTMIGIGLAGIWLGYDLWLYKDRFAVWFANSRVKTFRREADGQGLTRAKFRRSSIRDRARLIYGLSVPVVVLILYGLCFHLLRNKHIDEEKDDVRLHLTGKVSMPSDRFLKNARLTLSNDSADNITVTAVQCVVYTARMANGFMVKNLAVNWHPNISLSSGGGQISINCPSDRKSVSLFPDSQGIACADVIWKVVYYVKDRKFEELVKPFRYTLSSDDHEWESIPPEVKPKDCKVMP